MTADSTFVFGLILAAAVAMASNRIRYDIIALLVVIALMLSGTLSVGQALAGFGSSVVILVAGLLVVGEMLARTGVARAVGDWILQQGGGNETRLLALIMMGAALLGAVMSSTAVVAIFIPIVLRIAAETDLNGSRLLLPMSYAALISGMLTLIATTPNIVVHEELKNAGFDGFGFFSFSLIGAGILFVAIIYVLLIARKMLSRESVSPPTSSVIRSIEELWAEFRTTENYLRAEVGSHSTLNGLTIADSGLIDAGVRVLGIERSGGDFAVTPSPATELHVGDTLLILGDDQLMKAACARFDLKPQDPTPHDRKRWLWEFGAAKVLIHPESSLLGKTLRDATFRDAYDLHVVGLRRQGEAKEDFRNVNFQASDSLMVVGAWSRIRQLQTLAHDFVVTELPGEIGDIVPSYRKMPIALGILVLMVGVTLFDLIPLVAAVLLAGLVGIATRCLTMEDAYESIHWPSLVLIAGMLPLADALDVTGGTQLIVNGLMDFAGDAGPYVMLSVLFALTAGLGLVLSNTASAVLVAPIAIYAAASLEVSPYPFAVAVVIAASCAYSTPVSTPVVTLVVDPGGYRFTDFLKVGFPLLLLSFAVTLLLTPILFPFYP